MVGPIRSGIGAFPTSHSLCHGYFPSLHDSDVRAQRRPIVELSIVCLSFSPSSTSSQPESMNNKRATNRRQMSKYSLYRSGWLFIQLPANPREPSQLSKRAATYHNAHPPVLTIPTLVAHLTALLPLFRALLSRKQTVLLYGSALIQL